MDFKAARTEGIFAVFLLFEVDEAPDRAKLSPESGHVRLAGQETRHDRLFIG
jgi:hypothetical protein